MASAACAQFVLYNWQPLAGGGALVAGGFATCTATGRALAAYTARLDSATALATPRPAAAAGSGVVYPNPAQQQASWVGAVPMGAQQAELGMYDALGRRSLHVGVAGRGPAVRQVMELSPLGVGTYVVRLLADGQPVGSALKFICLP